MKIRVEFLGFHFAMKERDFQVDVGGTTLSDLVEELGRKVKSFRDAVIDETGNIDSGVIILLNGEEQVSREQLSETPLREGDAVTFMMMAGGG